MDHLRIVLFLALGACRAAPNAQRAENVAGELAECQREGRAADAGENLAVYRACKADAGLQ